MSRRPGYRRLLRLPRGKGRFDEVDEEVRFHIEHKVERLVREGLSREDALREAWRRFGDVETVKTAMQRESGKREGRMKLGDAIDSIRQDLAYALRQLVRAPGFTAVTLLTLTLGIGATTAIFSVVDGILFRPLPFEEPEELVAVWSDYTRVGGPDDEWPNFPNLWELREQSSTLEGVGIRSGSNATLTGLDGPAEFVAGAAISHDMFARVLNVEPAVGRGFTPEDDVPGAPPTVLLSFGLWTRAFGADPAVIGQNISMNGQSTTVLGVMAEDFRPPPILTGDYWVPLRMDMAEHQCGRGNACLHGIARLADGATLASARAEATEISRRQEAEFPQANEGIVWNLRPLQDDLVGNTRNYLLVLLGAAGFVLLAACVNQANLLTARATSRRSELALRAAMGAGRSRIVGQLLTESLVLALAGGALGVVAAFFLTDLLVALAPSGTPRLDELAVNGRALAFAALVSVGAGLVFGLFPALQGASGAPGDAMREGGRGSGRAAGTRSRRLLVVAQVSLALVLLVGSGLLVQSFRNLMTLDLGFRPEGVLSFRIFPSGARYPDRPALVAFHEQLEEALASLPGVESVGATSALPLAGFDSDVGFAIEGRPAPALDQPQGVWYRISTPRYLETAGTEIVRGRGLSPTDDQNAVPVVVVNETLARRYFPGEDPIGQRLNLGNSDEPVWREIVGVARDVRHFGARGDARNALYAPLGQFGARTMFYVLRTRTDPESLVPEVRAAISSLDPELAAGEIAPLMELVRSDLAPDRFITTLVALFAVVAGTLAVVGLYGVVSYDVNTRLKEMGVRLALGARPRAVGALVLRSNLRLVAFGVAIGLLGAVALGRSLGALLYDVETSDPLALVGGSVLLATAAAIATLIPARRAGRVDPVEVLRSE